jgi:ribosomal protein S18 acetylase RimI-like enzyme
MSLEIRPATIQDAGAMAELLNEIVAIGGTTAYAEPFDEAGIVDTFITPRFAISCFVAVNGSKIVGFQSLEWADPEWTGDDPLPSDWAIIATYVDPHAHKMGIGRSLFAETASAAKAAGATFIDATIRRENKGGQAYYQAMGFRDYRDATATISKRYSLG